MSTPVRLIVVGDIAWDLLMRPAADLVWGSDVYGSVDLLPGGAAANVAVWAHRLGANPLLAGNVGDDRLGDLMKLHLEREGLELHLGRVSGGSTTRIGIVIRADGERAFVTDHRRPLRLSADDLPLGLLDGADALFLNGYAVFMAGGTSFAGPLLDEARRRGVPIAFDPSSFTLIRHYGARRLLDELGHLDVLLANEEEWQALAGTGDTSALLERVGLVVIKQGAEGATALSGAARLSSPAVKVKVADTTGAGDAFDAAFLAEYFSGRNLSEALAAGNRLGGQVAGRVGAQTAG